MNQKKYLRNRLCFPVKGYNRSIVYDLVRNDYHLISNKACDLINTTDVIVLEDNDTIDILSQEILIKNEILFRIEDEKENLLFPNPSLVYDSPYHITDLVLSTELDVSSLPNLTGLEIENISLISNTLELINIRLFMSKLVSLEPKSIYLFVTKSEKYDYYEIMELKEYPELMKVFFFNSQIDVVPEHKAFILDIISINMSFERFSSFVFPQKFIVNNEVFLESQSFHTYYHKKVFIDALGNIKNGLLSKKSFGNFYEISQSNFLKIIDSQEFKELGYVKKNETLVCQDCEFRFMCTDARFPKKGIMGWYHEKECTYNPYISKWNFEEGYNNLNDVGVYIDKTAGRIEIKEQTLAKYNHSIWGDSS